MQTKSLPADEQITSWRYLVFLLFFLISFGSVAQSPKSDLPKESKPIWEKQRENNHDKFYLRKQALHYNYELCGYFSHLLNSVTITAALNKKPDFYPDIEIRNCHFSQSLQTVTHNYENCPSLNLKMANTSSLNIIENSFDDPLQLAGISGNINIMSNNSPYLMFSRSYGGDLNIQNTNTDAIIQVDQCQKRQFQLYNTSFKRDTAQIIISDSKFGQLDIGGINAKHSIVKLFRDTIDYFMLDQVMISDKTKLGKIEELTFINCHLSGDFIMAFEKGKSVKTIRFNSCTFSKDCKLFDLSADTVEFDNCLNIEKQLYMSGDSSLKHITLKLYNTEVTNINFNYYGKFKLFEGAGPENVKSNYENLLTKFEQEHKKVSYENADIAYSRYKHGKFISFFNWIWWDFGYNRWQIIWWTIGFLLFFTLFNYFSWKKVYKAYPLEKEDDHRSIRVPFNVFVYTALLFFSLRINFERLSFKSSFWLFYILLQYVAGLICLFFIVNAILKIN